jgi:hypothetical protein
MDAIGFELTPEYKDSFVMNVHSQDYGFYFSKKKKEE